MSAGEKDRYIAPAVSAQNCAHKMTCDSDYDEALAHYCDYMSESYAMGQVLGFKRDASRALFMERVEFDNISPESLQGYEMILFDGGNIYGDAWKCMFFPQQKQYFFLREDHA